MASSVSPRCHLPIQILSTENEGHRMRNRESPRERPSTEAFLSFSYSQLLEARLPPLLIAPPPLATPRRSWSPGLSCALLHVLLPSLASSASCFLAYQNFRSCTFSFVLLKTTRFAFISQLFGTSRSLSVPLGSRFLAAVEIIVGRLLCTVYLYSHSGPNLSFLKKIWRPVWLLVFLDVRLA